MRWFYLGVSYGDRWFGLVAGQLEYERYYRTERPRTWQLSVGNVIETSDELQRSWRDRGFVWPDWLLDGAYYTRMSLPLWIPFSVLAIDR